MVNRLLIL